MMRPARIGLSMTGEVTGVKSQSVIEAGSSPGTQFREEKSHKEQ